MALPAWAAAGSNQMAWGANWYGELGHGTDHLLPVPVSGLTGVTAVAAGTYHTVALKRDGAIGARPATGRRYYSLALASVSETCTGNPPDNDNFATSQVISGASGTLSASNACATGETGEPHASGASVWYSWTAPQNGRVTSNTSGSSFDTTLCAFTGSNIGSLTTVAFNDDVASGTVTSQVSFDVTAGSTYSIQVDGSSGASGAFNLTWNLTPYYRILGRIATSNGTALPNAVVARSGGPSTTTNSAGYYTLTNVPAGTYPITPSLSGYSFTPTSITVTVSNADVAGQDFTATVVTCVTAPTGLISWWPGDGNANDIKNNCNGTLQDGVLYSTGKVGQAFVTGPGYIRVLNSPSLTPQHSFTLEAWIYPETDQTGGIIGKWGDGGDYANQRSYYLRYLAGGLIDFRISDAAHQWDGVFHTCSTASGIVPLNTWSHVAAVYDQSTGSRYIYVNGVLQTSRTDAPITITSSAADVSIGAQLGSSTTVGELFRGRLDEVSYFNAALTQAQVQSIYRADSAGKCPPPPPTPHNIIGRVTNSSGVALSNVTVSRSGGVTAVTNSAGYYTFSGVLPGTYTVTPSLSGYSFTPASRTVTVTNADVTGQNFTATVITCVPAPAGLISWWPGEGNANDVVGGHQGTLTNGATATAAGEVGQAFNFDGFDDRLNVPDSPAFELTHSLTVECWARWENNVAMRAAETYLFVRGDNRAGFVPYSLAIRDNGNAQFKIFDGTTTVAIFVPVPRGAWMHLAGVVDDATNSMKLYLNGSLAAQGTTTVRPLGSLDPTQSPGIGIGNTVSPAYNQPFPGQIDEVTLYSRALTPTEVLNIYNASSEGKCPPVPHKIIGRITTSNGTALPNVVVSRSGGSTTVTNSAGYYTFTGVFPGTYTITAALSGYSFNPASRTVTIDNADVAGQNFTAIPVFTVSGHVANSGGTAIPNASLTLSPAPPGVTNPTFTNAAGNFSFTNVPAGNYVVTPTRPGSTFSPASKAVSPAAPTANFTIYFDITGHISEGAQGLGNVNVALTTNTGASVPGVTSPVLTNSNGDYKFSNVPSGLYNVTPTLLNYVFSPSSQGLSVTTVPRAANFSGTGFFKVYGRITNSSGIALSGVTVTLSGRGSLTTNSAGYFTFTNVPNGSYTVTPSQSGRTFNPTSRGVTVNGADVGGVSFIGS